MWRAGHSRAGRWVRAVPRPLRPPSACRLKWAASTKGSDMPPPWLALTASGTRLARRLGGGRTLSHLLADPVQKEAREFVPRVRRHSGCGLRG